ncbi:MAG: hypothetical protein KJ970_17765 [Candidatus Eisenbacteria bacterium]|uniref:Uncharacterized protein n=1 Tax=Eiseniibacteriota bacterium TaxID=2212470 RepID=A0A948WEH3_UNCEI|nr:hypothetical protein [Candidatus Eisenbacteria bacterium]MBU1949940.1 hypothetical protein [Candidatus Eisenbacteria bacterium]MBU2692768.1 hypothetical protein [Candidatus Eisenbacteria bacterium]
MKIADLTDDGRKDVLVGAFSDGYDCLEERGIALLRSQGDRLFNSVEWVVREAGGYLADFDTGDLNNDDLLDLSFVYTGPRTFLNVGDGQFEEGYHIEDMPPQYIVI